MRITIVSSVIFSSTSIGATVGCAIKLIYLALSTEDTWTDSTHAWVFVVNLGLLRGSIFVKKICP